MSEQVENLREAAEKKVRVAKRKASELKQAASERVTNFAQTTDRYVRANPWGAIAIVAVYAFAIGLLAGVRRT